MARYIYDEDGWSVRNHIGVVDSGLSATGREYLCFDQGHKQKWLPRDLFCPDIGPGLLALKDAGIIAIGPKQRSMLTEDIVKVANFRPIEIVESNGWNQEFFGYPNGRVFSPDGRFPSTSYLEGTVSVHSNGSFNDWFNQVGKLLKGQPLPLFCVMIGFAAPLLRLTRIQGNFGFMLSGPPRTGKTTCLDVTASICGPALDSEHGRYYLKFNNTMNRIEEWLPSYSDLPFIIDELSSHGNKSSRLNDFRTLVHYLAGVDQKGRKGDELKPASQTRTLILMSSNDDMNDLLSLETPAAAEAVSDRLMELPVNEGAFDASAGGFASSYALAETFRERVSLNYGTAMPRFLQKLVSHRGRNEANLIDGLRRRMAEFAGFSEVREAGSVSSRVIDAFALVYAAGILAQHYGVLPKRVDCRAAAIHCLHLHLGFRKASDPVERLLSWVQTHDVIDLRGGERPPLDKETLSTSGVFIGECKGQTQLWMHPHLFQNSIEGADSLLRRLKRKGLLKTEGAGKDAHDTIKCAVRLGKTDRLHVVKIPGFSDWLAANGRPRPAKRASKAK